MSGPSIVKFSAASIHDATEIPRVRARRNDLRMSLPAEFGRAFADLDPGSRANIERAAEMVAVVEYSRRAIAAGAPAASDLRDLARLEKLSREILMRIGLSPNLLENTQ